MLILIAGATGNIGKHATRHALDTGHQVRGLGRSPSKLPSDLSSRLESFVESTSYHDVPALEAACAGVDAVLCAYAGIPELHLDGQLLLLRAAERAGVKRFMAAGWNYDWRKIPFQSEPAYDCAIMFHAQVGISSTIKPLHIFSGMLAEVFFGPYFTPAVNNGVWDGCGKTDKEMGIWGTGDEVWQFTTEKDAGCWGVEALVADGAEEGGFITVCSFQSSLNELRRTYESLRGVKVKVNKKGSVDELYAAAEKQKKELGRAAFWTWHSKVFHANCVSGVWNLGNLENDKYPKAKATSLESFLKEHPEV